MQGVAPRIHEDKRTVGIEMSIWDLGQEANGLKFNIKDLAGQVLVRSVSLSTRLDCSVLTPYALPPQAIYALSNQYFLVSRAIFVLVWRAVDTLAFHGSRFQEVNLSADLHCNGLCGLTGRDMAGGQDGEHLAGLDSAPRARCQHYPGRHTHRQSFNGGYR